MYPSVYVRGFGLQKPGWVPWGMKRCWEIIRSLRDAPSSWRAWCSPWSLKPKKKNEEAVKARQWRDEGIEGVWRDLRFLSIKSTNHPLKPLTITMNRWTEAPDRICTAPRRKGRFLGGSAAYGGALAESQGANLSFDSVHHSKINTYIHRKVYIYI